ncbi:MAG: DUF4179 domain-containing protein [Oscillospiraceae bacterium]|nr:DUF4179 domain-containing protein [Oscillospiraceae bacterium]
MTEYRIDALSSAIGNIDTAYLEEALAFEVKATRTKRSVRFPKLSAACVALFLILGVSATAFAISRIPLSWRDIFSPSQTVIGDEDEEPVISQQQAAATEELQIKAEKVISDERTLYLLYSVKANDGAVLDQKGHFSDFALYLPGQMMSGAYASYFLERKDGVPENELEGVVYADWQPDDSANGLVMTFSNWQEEAWFDDAKVDFNIAELMANPGDAEIPLPYGGISLCGVDWEGGVLRLTMKGPRDVGEWSLGRHWYFIDTRTDTVIYPEQRADYYQPDEIDSGICYFRNYVPVDKKTLPYLEMHWGGKEVSTTVLAGEWLVTLDETPITVQSELLAENVPLSYHGEELLAEKVECSKLSMAVYFADYVDSTTGILGALKIFDAKGDAVPCDWGFTADQTDDSCMIWTRFSEPIEPETICKLTFNGDTIFTR